MATSQAPHLPELSNQTLPSDSTTTPRGTTPRGVKTPRSEQASPDKRPFSQDAATTASSSSQFGGYQPLPQINSPHSARSSSERMDVKQWASQTQKCRDQAREVRNKIGAHALSADAREKFDPVPQARPSNMTYLEEKLKTRQRIEQDISKKLVDAIAAIKETIASVTTANAALARQCNQIVIIHTIVDKRVDLRADLPEQEQVQDELQTALEEEQNLIAEAHRICDEWAKHGKATQAVVDGALAEMIANRLTLHLNRSDYPKLFLEKMREKDKAGVQFCRDLADVLHKVENVIKFTSAKTSVAIKRRMADLQKMRDQLQADLQTNEGAILQAQLRIEKWDKQIRVYDSQPENATGKFGDIVEGGFDDFWATAQLSFDQMRKVQAAIKSAAYTGADGRQVEMLFRRADKNGSGELDQDEFRSILRRTLKIPPRIISDPEVAAFCDSLDRDMSGTISIKEIGDFLRADLDIEMVRKQNADMKSMVADMYSVQEGLLEDARRKREAWLIDRAVQGVNVSKAREMERQGKKSTEKQRNSKSEMTEAEAEAGATKQNP
eukprot:TRINITY_DN107233_c0_g1_i1.p1 TRINITY_DN107233_c0_g1~~TRINITY_DN107233_c0_g1_i1.p1  ORF type:complete len:554 (-),score=134.62 TRINITY_DN107233_c0_g1_i1:23-1684(-)